MRFNKQELATLAQQPSNKFEREGTLYITEKQDGFFRRAEVSLERWCRLRGNLLFYFKTSDPFSEPQGLIVLEKCQPCVGNAERDHDGYVFYIEFQDGLKQRLAAASETERSDWVQAIQLAGYDQLRRQLQRLRELIERRRGNANGDVDVDMVRLQVGKEIDIGEVPLCETAIACDNLLCDGHGRAPNPSVVVQVAGQGNHGWVRYSRTEVVERCSNPQFMCTIAFRACDGLHAGSLVRFTVYDVREKLSQTAVPLGTAEITLGAIQESARLRIPLRSTTAAPGSSTTAAAAAGSTVPGAAAAANAAAAVTAANAGNSGFLTLSTWTPDVERMAAAARSPAKLAANDGAGCSSLQHQTVDQFEEVQQPQQQKQRHVQSPQQQQQQQQQEQAAATRGHRRSQSLPPKLGVKLFVPAHHRLAQYFANPNIHTYRFHSGLGGDISVQELMMESQLCFVIPQQLLSIWILREKELLQEISGMGELGGCWRTRQMELLDKHLKLLKDYSQAKQNLQQAAAHNSNKFFRTSASKTDDTCEFAPINLHLQRMWAHNDTLKRAGQLDVITVGAFTRHAGKTKTGGLIKLLQLQKDSPSKVDQNGVKVLAANDAVQAIKQLRKEIVEIMTQLLCLAKLKNPKGMLPLCNDMVTKTRVLLNIWEPNLVEEAFAFIEQHRTVEENSLAAPSANGDDGQPPQHALTPASAQAGAMILSPFRKITAQLGALDLKSPDLEDFATPMGPAPDLWPSSFAAAHLHRTHLATGANGSGGGGGEAAAASSGHGNATNALRAVHASPSASDINAIASVQSSVQDYSRQMQNDSSMTTSASAAPADTEDADQATSNGRTVQRTNADTTPADEAARQRVVHDMQQSRNEILHNSVDFDAPIMRSGTDANAAAAAPNAAAAPSAQCSIAFGMQQQQHGGGAFLDTKMMSSSPSANYYRPTEEPEPLDLTQLNIEASVMCLVSKVKFLCGRCGSPAVRLRQPKQTAKRGFGQQLQQQQQQPPDVVSNAARSPEEPCEAEHETEHASAPTTTAAAVPTALHLPTSTTTSTAKKPGNKFTDGLDLSLTTDWAAELRPSMRKLRQAMDGLLKTARLMHSVQRLQQDMRRTSAHLATMYRRDVCFSQALTAVVAGLMAKLWGTAVTPADIAVLGALGPLAYFEGLLSLYGAETDMWGDMCVAVEDVGSVRFTLVRAATTAPVAGISSATAAGQPRHAAMMAPRVVGSRHAMTVLLPVPETVFAALPAREATTFKVTPVFFNIGINEKATLSETLGYTREQHRSNWDNFDRLKQYHIRHKKLPALADATLLQTGHADALNVADLLCSMEDSLRSNAAKNVKILHLAEDICRALGGVRLTSCKSAKDRTAMAVTLEQTRILQREFHLPEGSVQRVLDTVRGEGTRSDNTLKNVGLRKYAFNLPQVMSLPIVYRPPTGSYGKAQT